MHMHAGICACARSTAIWCMHVQMRGSPLQQHAQVHLSTPPTLWRTPKTYPDPINRDAIRHDAEQWGVLTGSVGTQTVRAWLCMVVVRATCIYGAQQYTQKQKGSKKEALSMHHVHQDGRAGSMKTFRFHPRA
jgi:hypothetical protein